VTCSGRAPPKKRGGRTESPACHERKVLRQREKSAGLRRNLGGILGDVCGHEDDDQGVLVTSEDNALRLAHQFVDAKRRRCPDALATH
jgi:hypothetical protein